MDPAGPSLSAEVIFVGAHAQVLQADCGLLVVLGHCELIPARLTGGAVLTFMIAVRVQKELVVMGLRRNFAIN